MPSQPERVDRILAFLHRLDGFKSVYRAAHLSDGSRHESDAEHCWHLCMFVLLLLGEVDAELDERRVLELCLIHDLVEIYAGDTPAYDDAAATTKERRERAAANRLFGELPPDLGRRLRSAWEEFEDRATPESRFVAAVDRLQAVAQNVFSEGAAWKEWGATEDRVRAFNAAAMASDPALGGIFELLLGRARRESMFGVE